MSTLISPKLETVIMGIDPGTNILGYGIIGVNNKTLRLLSAGVIKLGQFSDPYQKLHHIHVRVTAMIKQYKPIAVAIEAPFYGKNVQSMLKLGRAQGVAIAAAVAQNLEVIEYAPRKIKQSVTGKGNASKEQVAAMLQNILQVELTTQYDDATDGLAAAICYHFQTTGYVNSNGKTKGKGWSNFINQYPDRLIH